MIEFLKAWYDRNLSNPQSVILVLMILLGTIIVLYWGDILAPVLASMVIAYALEGIVRRLNNVGTPRILAVIFTVFVFVTSLLIILLGLVPLVARQLTSFVRDFPYILDKIQQRIIALPERYPLISDMQVNEVITTINNELVAFGQKAVSYSLASAGNLFTMMVYLIVIPLLVFFMLKDKNKIITWLTRFLPKEHGLAYKVWKDVDIKMGNYIRGKLLEIMIVGVAAYIPFELMGLNYAATLSLFIGLSVIIPYVGAIAVTIPVALIAWFQWGPGDSFLYVMIIYLIIQALDANVLVPLLFSEVVNMHPVAIIISVLVFGGLWGVWGVFFAIPLATLVQAVINAWPRVGKELDTGN
ncbi:MAG: AI-2E family transporter [Gammaproteobacteria bacterium]|nr:AI-2E family transporter [Gammaproteobacteria bacterium]NNL07100.1 AI-2E family transporter [Gammaproteobacteria bacterium]